MKCRNFSGKKRCKLPLHLTTFMLENCFLFSFYTWRITDSKIFFCCELKVQHFSWFMEMTQLQNYAQFEWAAGRKCIKEFCTELDISSASQFWVIMQMFLKHFSTHTCDYTSHAGNCFIYAPQFPELFSTSVRRKKLDCLMDGKGVSTTSEKTQKFPIKLHIFLKYYSPSLGRHAAKRTRRVLQWCVDYGNHVEKTVS